MALQIFRFLAVVLTALALVPGGAHLAALANKMALGQSDYFVVQGIYAGWAFFGVVIIAALLANAVHGYLLGRAGYRAGLAWTASVLIAVNLAVFFAWTFPANQATQNWTATPPDWSALRVQWEYSHAANAVIMLAALVCATLAVLRLRSKAS